MQFDFATSTRILFGSGMVRELPAAARSMGKRAMVVTGANAGRAERVRASLKEGGIECVSFAVPGEPSVDLVRSGSEYGRAEKCDLVIAIGGGSAIDGGKALAAMIANPGDPLDYLEVIGRGRPLPNASLPFIAIPTTAGTGSEVTRNAVLGSAEHRVKASLRSASMLPRLALVDPELTHDLPRAITASTGLDALTQLIEPYLSVRANAMTDLFCVEGMRRAVRALPRAWEDGHDREARTEMSWASLLGGLSLANAALGAVHGFAAPVGGMFPAPHGAICAAVLPHALRVNLRALEARAPESQALRRCAEIAAILTSRANAAAAEGVRWIAELCGKLEIPPLRMYGVEEADIPVLVEKAAKASSMKGNPIPLTSDELREIITAAL